jgi:hypothetical protein
VEWEVALISRYTKIHFEFPPKKCFHSLEEKEKIESIVSSISSVWPVVIKSGETILELNSTIEQSVPFDCISSTKIKITFPCSAYRFCTDEECKPILCTVIAGSSVKCISRMLNFVPANMPVIFGNSSNCSILEPVE